MDDLKELEQHAKKVVNERRKQDGKRALGKLKKGIPLRMWDCTLAMSLDYLGRGWVQALQWDTELDEFAAIFDKRGYPHLEIPLSPIKIKKPGQRKLTVLS